MNQLIKDVLAFHCKNDLPMNITIPDAIMAENGFTHSILTIVQQRLIEAICDLQNHAHQMEQSSKDHRPYRILLLLHEFKELIEAMQKGQKETAHELSDMVYLLFGTAIACGIPLDRVVREVHRSNMTKEGVCPDHSGKSGDYVPPDIEKALYENV